MRISDWSSDVCSSDLILAQRADLDAQIAALDRLALAQRVDDRRRLFRRDGEADADIAAGGREDLAVDADHIAAHAIGRAHVGTPVTNAHLVCRRLLEKKKNHKKELRYQTKHNMSEQQQEPRRPQ